MTRVTRPLSELQFGQLQRAHTELLVNGRQDSRRLAGPELGWWSQALAHRLEYPANIWFVGDSMTECFGATDDYHTWVDLVRTAIQGRYRSGGFGYIPAKHAQAATWPYTTNPDGKNTWAITAGAEVDNVDYGFGVGRRCSFMAVACARTITIDCDRFAIVYSTNSFTGSMTIDVDAGTPNAQTATFTTASAHPRSGVLWDSKDNGAFVLTNGTHTVKVTCSVNNVLLDGIMVYATDALSGVHTFNGGHYGYKAGDFNNSAAVAGFWGDLAYQPYTPVVNASFVGNGTTTVTNSSIAAFTDLDIGEYIHFEGGLACTNSMARIVARASGTSITVDRAVAAGTFTGCLNRAQIADGAITSGSTTLTSASLPFNPWDVGLYVMGPTGIPTGVYIRRYNGPGSVELSTAATATQTAQTVRFLGKQKYWMAPDVLVVEFGFNEDFQGAGTDFFKQTIRDLVSYAKERAGIGFPVAPALTGPQRYNPSVVLLGLWAPGGIGSVSAYVTATNGSPIITSNEFDFDQADVGKSITNVANTPIPASSTIASVQSNRQATLNNNAVANSTGLGAYSTIVNRVSKDKYWQRFRVAMFELASENVWRFFDLYSMAGFIDIYDPLNLTYDFVHPNNRGAQWIADEFDIVLTGQPKNAAIPQGIIDAPGDKIVGQAADLAGKLPAGNRGQVMVEAPFATLGVRMAAPYGATRLIQQTTVNPTGIVTNNVGSITVAPTITAAAVTTNADTDIVPALSLNTAASSASASKILSAFTLVRRGWIPEYSGIWAPGGTITTVRYWVGLFSGDPSGSAAPAISLAAFRYDTGAGDTTGKWSIATSNAGTQTVKATNINITASIPQELAIIARGTFGGTPTSYDFYINDILAGSLTANLPATGLILGKGGTVTALAASARSLVFSRDTLTSI